MPSNEIMNKIEQFLRHELSDIAFDELCYGDSEDDVFADFLSENLPNCYDVRCGASKVVLFYKELSELGFCVKIPFIGMDWNSDDEYNCKRVYFHRANVIFPIESDYRKMTSDWDYCNVEEFIGELAAERNLDQFFARTYYLCSINHHPIYISELVDSLMAAPFDWYKSPTWVDSYEIGLNLKNDIIDEVAMAFFVDNYGESACRRFLDFVYEMGIGDLHDGNIGFHNGIIQLIDYSNFND